ncbi:metal ABC transporter ATP-binding protein [Clostridiales bacterium COT073_COT-073]|nr:metal ABC transporter ATP-binding protein [Clostridiales bacterium COT073_COT-073]
MPILKVNHLQVNYGQTMALTDVNLEVEACDFIGIIGPNGGGKTSLIKAILGIIKPVRGTIELDPGETLGYVPQLTTFDRNFPITVLEVILLGHLPKRITLGHRFTRHEKEHAAFVMERLGIGDLKKRQIGELSGGQMQRVLVARALMTHPTILVLDEPTAGVDEASKKEIYQLLAELNKNMTILMITHDQLDTAPFISRFIYVNKTICRSELPIWEGLIGKERKVQ